MPLADSWHNSGEYPPYYPDSVRAILFGDDLPHELADKLGAPVNIGSIVMERLAAEESSSRNS